MLFFSLHGTEMVVYGLTLNQDFFWVVACSVSELLKNKEDEYKELFFEKITSFTCLGRNTGVFYNCEKRRIICK